ncbi:ABC transporter substrate-binding protein (plasmid) [Geminicoccaceae bacterium 1502E]|nr:ABC transporter substrate-binding protein [Geminicoccaceae bacterium 1502E]
MTRKIDRRTFGKGTAGLLLGSTFLGGARSLRAQYAAPAEGGRRGGKLTVGSIVEPPALDPFHQGADARIQVTVLMYQGLMFEDASGTAQPLLAESHELSQDGLTYTFKLRRNAVFHGGRPMTAADVKYSYDYVRNPENGSPGAGDYATIEEITVLDDHTVQMRLSEPNAALLMTLTNKYGGVVPEGYFADQAARARMNQQSVGTGPYMLAQFQPNSFLTLRRNPDYWDENSGLLDEITFVYLPNAASMLVALRSGRVDMAVLSRPQDAAQIEDAANLEIRRFPSFNQKSIDLDLAYEPLAPLEVRQAIALAVDKTKIMQAAIGGFGTVIGTMPAGMQEGWGAPVDELPNQGPDLARAKDLMDKAGHAGGLEVTLTTIIGYDWMDPAAVTLAEQLKPIGIDLQINKVDLGVWINNFRSRKMGFTFNDWGTQPDPSLLFYRHFHKQPEGADFRNWNDGPGSELLDKGRQESDPAKRRAIYVEFQKRLAEQVPTIMMFSSDHVVVSSKKVKNYRHHPTGWYFGLADAWVEET